MVVSFFSFLFSFFFVCYEISNRFIEFEPIYQTTSLFKKIFKKVAIVWYPLIYIFHFFIYNDILSWTPDKLTSCVDSFITAIDHNIKNSLVKPFPKDNLAKSEREALKNLQQRDDIIITNAEKGGAVVIIYVQDYIKEANRQLSDTSNYQKLNIDPAGLYTGKIKAVINKYKDTEKISSKMANSVVRSKVKTPVLYLLLKIHKPNNPRKPLISSIDCHTSSLSEFVNHYLQPAATKFK